MDGQIPPTYPLRVNTPGPGVRSVQFTGRQPSPAEAIARTRVDTFTGTARAPAAEKVSKLVAGAVDVPVNFDSGPANAASGGAMPMYRHPADKNAAATGVTLGRRVDVTG